MTVRLLQNVADEPKGAVLTVTEDRARRLIRTGYAVEVKPKPSKKEKE